MLARFIRLQIAPELNKNLALPPYERALPRPRFACLALSQFREVPAKDRFAPETATRVAIGGARLHARTGPFPRFSRPVFNTDPHQKSRKRFRRRKQFIKLRYIDPAGL